MSGDNMGISLSGTTDDGAMLPGYFDRLAEGGAISMPLEKQRGGDEFGLLTDRFGVPWMVDFGAPTGDDAMTPAVRRLVSKDRLVLGRPSVASYDP